MGAEYQIHEVVAGFDALHYLRLLHHAAAQGDHHVGIFFLVSPQLAQTAVHALVGVFTHGAGVVEHEIGVLGVRGFVADGFQDAEEFFGVSGVHLAAEGIDTAGEGAAQGGRKSGQLFTGFFHVVLLALGFLNRSCGSGLRRPIYRDSGWFHSYAP